MSPQPYGGYKIITFTNRKSPIWGQEPPIQGGWQTNVFTLFIHTFYRFLIQFFMHARNALKFLQSWRFPSSLSGTISQCGLPKVINPIQSITYGWKSIQLGFLEGIIIWGVQSFLAYHHLNYMGYLCFVLSFHCFAHMHISSIFEKWCLRSCIDILTCLEECCNFYFGSPH
jgi:hypothetical protein